MCLNFEGFDLFDSFMGDFTCYGVLNFEKSIGIFGYRSYTHSRNNDAAEFYWPFL